MEQARLQPRDVYRIGEIYEFRVKRPYATYCELIDEPNGINTYLQGTAKLKLFKGQAVKCRILAVSEKHPKIELVDIREFEESTENLTEEKLSDLLSRREISWSIKDFIRLLLTDEKEKPFESQCHKWIQTLLNKKIDLKTVRRDCSDLLELSDLLNLCSDTERDYYQERLTLLIEQIGYYIRAAELIENETAEGSTDTPTIFIDNLFNKLKISGFVYHPEQNFKILSSLFLRRPDLMNSRIKELLDIIRQRKLKSWEKEPFRSALIKLLELYVHECDGKIDKTKDNEDLISNNMTALAIQLLLIGDRSDTSMADYRLNNARLSTISSYLYAKTTYTFMDMALYFLFHSKPKKISYNIDTISIVPHYIASMYPCEQIDTINTFTQNNAKLTISADGIQLSPSRSDKNTYAVFPKELGLWQGMQVYLNSKPKTSLAKAKPNDIKPYQDVWQEIESEFFNTQAQVKLSATAPLKRKRQHSTDDLVRISFVRQDWYDKNKYYCQIEDEIGGEGFIYIKDIVPYSLSTSLRHFMSSDGCRFVFEAWIVNKEYDLFHFSMQEIIKEVVTDNYYSYDEDIICSLGAAPNARGEAPAISKEGVSVTLRNAYEFPEIGKNSIVSCHLIGEANGAFHIQCDINELTAFDYDLSSAFKILMEDMSVGRISAPSDEGEDEQILKTDKVLDESYVREVVYLIDRMAILDKDYVKSYNYLAFARVLCMLIGWESQSAYYKGRMDIITMLHDFAKNEKVDEEELSKLENVNAELFSNNVILRERFMQLQTVSYMGNPAHNDDLYQLANSNPWLRGLAQLCLAYNITLASHMENTANDIHNKIKQQLNLKGFETGLKKYGKGEEGVDEEYKTSIVFCADENIKRPNQEMQMAEILKVINSFLNTRGGTLYIGVNDYGLGIGVEEDLKTPLYYGDKDKYLRTITDAVSLKWGNAVATYIEHIDWDYDNKNKDVVIVKIKPLAQGVALDGYWYVRVGSTKRKITKEAFEEYQKYTRKFPASNIQELPEETVDIQPEAPIAAPALITSKDDTIKTSRIRKNVLTEWDDPENFVEPIGFFKFLSNGKFRKIDTYDFDEDSLQTLVVKDGEEKSFLILGYDNGCIVKVPVEELLEYASRDYSRNTESKLIFATIANGQDAVLTISKENKSRPKTLMRLDQLSAFDEGRLLDSGIMPCNEGLMSKVLAFDVIPHDSLEDFTAILDKPKTTPGLPANESTKGMVNKLHLWGISEI